MDSLPTRRVPRAALVIEAQNGKFLAFDGAGLVQVPEPPDGARIRALSADGTLLLLVTVSGDGVGVQELATGTVRWFGNPDPEFEHDRHTAPSPDGAVIAVLGHDDGDEVARAVVSLLDPATGERRRLWSAVGAAGFECGVCWSPDGALLAVTYLVWDADTGDDALSTVVLDPATGTAPASYPIATIASATSATWADDRDLVYRAEYDDLNRRFVADPRAGTVRATPELTGRVWGVAGGRHVQELADHEAPGAETSEFYTTDLDGRDRRPLFSYRPRVNADSMHLAPGVFPSVAADGNTGNSPDHRQTVRQVTVGAVPALPEARKPNVVDAPAPSELL
uniref:hypothetical protein n=1 Tax=Herbidospora sakaeratensis TaxID=564415 RepID=UPI0007848080|nr:hypothetical protein [Herbidospora sakaeratensis]